MVKPAIVARGGAVVWDPNPPRLSGHPNRLKDLKRPDNGCNYRVSWNASSSLGNVKLSQSVVFSGWILSRPPAPPVGSAVEANVGGFGGASPVPPPVPAEANAVVAWIQAPRVEDDSNIFSIFSRMSK